MATYTKITKDTSTYTKRDKSDEGRFKQGWFSNWFKGKYRRITKAISVYTKVEKEI